MEVYKIDAKGRALGRVATEVALILRGKNSPDFKPNVAPKNIVHVEHASLMKITAKKADSKEYKRYTGYPGGLRAEKMKDVIKKKGYEEILRKAVYGMLPANKLRKPILKNLKVTD